MTNTAECIINHPIFAEAIAHMRAEAERGVIPLAELLDSAARERMVGAVVRPDYARTSKAEHHHSLPLTGSPTILTTPTSTTSPGGMTCSWPCLSRRTKRGVRSPTA